MKYYRDKIIFEKIWELIGEMKKQGNGLEEEDKENAAWKDGFNTALDELSTEMDKIEKSISRMSATDKGKA